MLCCWKIFRLVSFVSFSPRQNASDHHSYAATFGHYFLTSGPLFLAGPAAQGQASEILPWSCVCFGFGFGFITGSCETMLLKVQVHMHIDCIIPMADSLNCRLDSWLRLQHLWLEDERADTSDAFLTWIVLLGSVSLQGYGTTTIHSILRSTIQQIFRTIQFWAISFPFLELCIFCLKYTRQLYYRSYFRQSCYQQLTNKSNLLDPTLFSPPNNPPIPGKNTDNITISR